MLARRFSPFPAVTLAVALLAAALSACGAQQAPSEGEADRHACATCHLPEYQSAKHHAGERPTTCGVCHTQAEWHPSRLEHPFWELTGAHASAKCFGCHQGTPAVFKGTKKDCVACHQTSYDEAPGHAGRFPTTCAECHTTAAWKPTLPRPEEPPAEPSASASASESVVTPPAPKPPPRWPSPYPKPKSPGPSPSSSSTPTAPAPSATPPPDTVTAPSKRRK